MWSQESQNVYKLLEKREKIMSHMWQLDIQDSSMNEEKKIDELVRTRHTDTEVRFLAYPKISRDSWASRQAVLLDMEGNDH